MARRIELSQDQFATVDDADFVRLSRFKWYAQWNPATRSFYAQRKAWVGDKRINERMHRQILGLKHGDGRQVDHANHDTLDNRRGNLEIVTCRKNHENRRDQSKHGVGIRKYRNRFQLRIRVGGGRFIKTFDTVEEAAAAREKILRRLDRECAC